MRVTRAVKASVRVAFAFIFASSNLKFDFWGWHGAQPRRLCDILGQFGCGASKKNMGGVFFCFVGTA
jgi:hypothetical protein